MLRRIGESSSRVLRASSASTQAQGRVHVRRYAATPVTGMPGLSSPPTAAPSPSRPAASTSPRRRPTVPSPAAKRSIESSDIMSKPDDARRLNVAMVLAMSPAGGGQPNAVHLLAAVKPMIMEKRHHRLLERSLQSINSTLASYYAQNAVPDDDLPALQSLFALATIDYQSLLAQRETHKESTSMITARYANWLVAEAKRADPERLARIQETFHAQVETMGARLLPLPFAAAWTVMIHRLDLAEIPELNVDLPSLDHIVNYISKRKWVADTDMEGIAAAAHRLCDAGDFARLPSKSKLLERRLNILRERGRVSAIHDMWKRFRGELHRGTHPLVTNEERRIGALGSFLFISRHNTIQLNSTDFQLMQEVEAEAGKMLPSPLPLTIFHRLLDTVAAEDDTKPRDKHAILPAAQKIWEDGKKDGIKFTALTYRKYLAVLGRYHDSKALFAVWDEIVMDKECRLHEAIRRSEGLKPEAEPVGPANQGTAQEAADKTNKKKVDPLSIPWPPTFILNETMSLAFNMGGPSADMAMALYHTAMDPKSSLAADIFTVNVALRFAAHLADLKMMNAILGDAAKLGEEPDIVTYTTMVQGMLRADRNDLARKTLDAMRGRGFEINDRLGATIISDLVKDGTADNLRRAEDVARDMRTRGVKMTVPAWTALISGYFRGGWVLDGWRAIERMYQSGQRLNIVGYNIVLGHTLTDSWRKAQDGDVQLSPAIRIFRRMLQESVTPTADTYSMMLGSLLTQGRIREVAEVLADVDKRGFRTYRSSLQNVIRKARQAVRDSGIQMPRSRTR